MFVTSEKWISTYPGAAVGVLAMRNVANPRQYPELTQRKRALEATLRARYAEHDRAALKDLPTLQAYAAYYKGFKKTYHVQLQLESVVFKEKPIPSVAALVEAMFMAELDNLLLTAGHDLDALALPLKVDVAEGDECYPRLNGLQQRPKPGDMYIADGQGIISSIIYGPDRRTQITAETQAVLFTVYAPPGIEARAVQQHLQAIQENVLVIAPQASIELSHIYTAG